MQSHVGPLGNIRGRLGRPGQARAGGVGGGVLCRAGTTGRRRPVVVFAGWRQRPAGRRRRVDPGLLRRIVNGPLNGSRIGDPSGGGREINENVMKPS